LVGAGEKILLTPRLGRDWAGNGSNRMVFAGRYYRKRSIPGGARAMARPKNLAAMSFDALVKLRGDVTEMLGRQAAAMQEQLARLTDHLGTRSKRGRKPKLSRPQDRRPAVKTASKSAKKSKLPKKARSAKRSAARAKAKRPTKRRMARAKVKSSKPAKRPVAKPDRVEVSPVPAHPPRS